VYWCDDYDDDIDYIDFDTDKDNLREMMVVSEMRIKMMVMIIDDV